MSTREVFCREPDFVCPACEHREFLDDYFEYGKGSERTCPKCGVVSECIEEQVVRFWRWQTTDRKEEVSDANGS